MHVRFGDYRLDAGTRQLFRSETEVHLSPKAFDLLRLLIEARPSAVSKLDLTERLWPATFVSDANLAVLVGEVRNALGDRGGQPRFIRTVHRFGYAFSGTAEQVPQGGRPVGPGGMSRWLVMGSRRIELTEGETVVGRDPHAGAWIDLGPVSRQHARITVEAGSVLIEDLGSRNGTFVRGRRISEPAPLKDRDEFRLGSVVVQFREWKADETRDE